MSKTNKSGGDQNYGTAAKRLEEILETIESGEVDVDQLSGLVEEAAGLVQLCRGKISAAEHQVRRITEELERDVSQVPTSTAEITEADVVAETDLMDTPEEPTQEPLEALADDNVPF